MRNLDVPSWVADWTVSYSHTPLPFYHVYHKRTSDGKIKHRQNIFAASKDVPPHVSFDTTGRRLVARGLQCDQVVAVSIPRDSPPNVSLP